MKIKAVVFPEADRYEIRELTLKEPGPDDIVVETIVSAISPGTERWTLRGKHLGTVFPCAPGYHRIGIVKSRGERVLNFEPGDIVYGTGSAWEEDVRPNSGAHVSASSGPSDGYRYISSKMPGKFELETTVFTIVAAVAARGINACGVKKGDRVLIIGAGFIGICAAQLAVFRGAHPVIVDKDAERIEFARRFARTLQIEDGGIDGRLAEAAPAGFDVLYDTAGVAEATDKLVKHTRGGGTLLLQSQYFDRERCAIDLDAVKVKEITIKTTCGISSSDWSETIGMIQKRILKIAPLITHRFGEDEILKGYDLLHTGKPFNMGIVFHWKK